MLGQRLNIERRRPRETGAFFALMLRFIAFPLGV
jgi:hypothetical protein